MGFRSIHLEQDIRYAKTFFKRLKGLLFYKPPFKDKGLFIAPCNSVHMVFMKFPIDVVFLDRQNQVVRVVSDLKPWKMVPPVKNAYAALELPVGTIEQKRIKIGDTIVL